MGVIGTPFTIHSSDISVAGVDQQNQPTVQSGAVSVHSLLRPLLSPILWVDPGWAVRGPNNKDPQAWRAEKAGMGGDRKFTVQQGKDREKALGGGEGPGRPAEGRVSLTHWHSKSWGLRPHMKVQKSRALGTGWAWRPGPVKREASWRNVATVKLRPGPP